MYSSSGVPPTPRAAPVLPAVAIDLRLGLVHALCSCVPHADWHANRGGLALSPAVKVINHYGDEVLKVFGV